MGPTDATEIEWLLYAPGCDALAALDRIDVRAHFVDSSEAFGRALTTERPSVVLLAVPPGTAEDVALLGRERRRREGVTAVVLAADDTVGAQAMATAAGIDEALPIGTSLAALVRRFDSSRSDGHRNGESEMTVTIEDGLEVAVLAHELRRDGTAVHLRPREHALLLFLARHPGHVFTRQDLLEAAWGPHRDGDPRTVDVHVRWLREKLEEDPSAPRHLLTERGMGYRLASGPGRPPVPERH